MKKIKIGQAGLGEWGLVIAEAMSKIPAFQIVACFDSNSSLSAKYRKRYNAIEVNSYQAAQNNKHVFVEKPITTNLSKARLLVKTFHEKKLVIAVGHNVRFYGIIKRTKELIENGELGDIVLVEANRSMPRGLTLSNNEWRWAGKNMPGGVLSQLGIHIIFLVQLIR